MKGLGSLLQSPICTRKPFDVSFVVAHAARTGVAISAENHSIISGPGSAGAETLAETQVRTVMKFKKMGIADTFAEGGTTAYLFDKYGLSSHHIVVAISVLLG